MERHKEDRWSSSHAPRCCKEKKQTCLSYLGTRLVWNVWQDHRLKQKLKQQQTGDDEAVCIRLCLKEGLFGQLDLQKWQTEAR